MKKFIIILFVLLMSFHILSRNNNNTHKVSEQNISIKNIVSSQNIEDKNERKNVAPQVATLAVTPRVVIQEMPKEVALEPQPEEVVEKSFDTEHVTPSPNTVKVQNNNFTCDGRIYCSQMTSCEEATFFLKNCPNVKMDGGKDGQAPDGIPCESQWCN